MAIFIEGNTDCCLCKNIISHRGEALTIAYNMDLPPPFERLRDGCVHRECLRKHEQRDIFMKYWSKFWVDNAKNFGSKIFIKKNGLFFNKKIHFKFIWYSNFIELEELIENLDKLRLFFHGSSDNTSKTKIGFNNYTISSIENGVILTIEEDRGCYSIFKTPSIRNYSFSTENWSDFVLFWSLFDKDSP